MSRPIILVGGGGHCRSVIDAAESAGIAVRGILELPALVGHTILGYPVVGTDDDMHKFASECDFIITIGALLNPEHRMRLMHNIEAAGGRLGTVIASTARVSRHASISEGTVVLHNACVNAGASVGRNCIVNTLANVEHDTTIGDFTHISTGATINGACRIGNGCFIGSGATVVNNVCVADGICVGAGAVVIKDIEEVGNYAGIPAVKIHSDGRK